MKTFRMIGMALIAIFLSMNFATCSNDDEIEAEKEAIPLSFKNGDEIYLKMIGPVTNMPLTDSVYFFLEVETHANG